MGDRGYFLGIPLSYLLTFLGFLLFGLLEGSIILAIIMGISVFVGGNMLDNFSTYLCAKKYGMNAFLALERNENAKCYVSKFGLTKGLLLSTLDPRYMVRVFILMLIFLAGALPLSVLLYFSFLVSFMFALIFVGFLHLWGAVNNFIVFFLESKIES